MKGGVTWAVSISPKWVVSVRVVESSLNSDYLATHTGFSTEQLYRNFCSSMEESYQKLINTYNFLKGKLNSERIFRPDLDFLINNLMTLKKDFACTKHFEFVEKLLDNILEITGENRTIKPIMFKPIILDLENYIDKHSKPI